MAIHQGDIYWVTLDGPAGGGYPHPHVVVQDDAINNSPIKTVVVCAVTTNLKRAKLPGNILLESGEANLSRQSVVLVSRVSMIEKTQLGKYVGSLSRQRVDQILAGMRFIERLISHHETGEG